MSNQHNRNFGKLIEAKTNLSVAKFLQQCSSQGLTYCETGDLFGFQQNTVRKWCRRFNVQLYNSGSHHDPSLRLKQPIEIILDNIRLNSINSDNALYKLWQ
jgi:transposase-like protein